MLHMLHITYPLLKRIHTHRPSSQAADLRFASHEPTNLFLHIWDCKIHTLMDIQMTGPIRLNNLPNGWNGHIKECDMALSYSESRLHLLHEIPAFVMFSFVWAIKMAACHVPSNKYDGLVQGYIFFIIRFPVYLRRHIFIGVQEDWAEQGPNHWCRKKAESFWFCNFVMFLNTHMSMSKKNKSDLHILVRTRQLIS